MNLLFASSASNPGDFEIAGSQSELNEIDEDQSPVPEGLKYYKPPRRRWYKEKRSEPKGKHGIIAITGPQPQETFIEAISEENHFFRIYFYSLSFRSAE